MLNIARRASFAAFIALALSGAARQGLVEVPSPLQKPLSDYARSRTSFLAFTGETAECIGMWDGGRKMRIDRTIGLDEFHILFEMDDNSYFINEIADDKGCTGFRKNGGYSIDIGARSERDGICAGDKAQAWSGGDASFPGRKCEIGVFHRLVRRSRLAG